MYCMAPSPSPSRRGGSPWQDIHCKRPSGCFAGADIPWDKPPGQSAEAARIRHSAFHPVRLCAWRSAMIGHPRDAPFRVLFAGAAASCVTRLRTAIAAVAFPPHVPFLQRNRAGLSGSEKKKPYPYPNSPIPRIMPFSCFFLQKNAIFFFLRARSPAASFPPLYAYGRKDSFIPMGDAIAERKKRAGFSFA